MTAITPFDLLTLCRTWRWPVRRYQVAAQARPLGIVTIGESRPLRNLLAAAVAPLDDPLGLEACSLGGLRSAIRTLGREADLVAIRVPRLLPLGRVGPRLPELIGAGGTTAALVARSRKPKSSAGRMRQRSEHSGLRYRVVTDAAAFDRFYDQHYRPMVAARFGDRAILRPREALRRRYAAGWLVELIDGDMVVAGQLLSASRGTLHKLVLGSCLPPAEGHARGLPAALQIATLDFAEQRGFGRIHMGASLPLLADGVLQRKLTLGCGLEPMPYVRFDVVLHWQRWSPAVDRLLALQPLARDGQGGYYALIDETAEPCLPTVARRLGLAGRRLPRGTSGPALASLPIAAL